MNVWLLLSISCGNVYKKQVEITFWYEQPPIMVTPLFLSTVLQKEKPSTYQEETRTHRINRSQAANRIVHCYPNAEQNAVLMYT
jgi:hypothetical protein